MAVRTYQERLGLLRDILSACGYADEQIVDDFQVWISQSVTVSPDLVAFVRSDQRDMTTSAIVATVSDSEEEITARWLGAASALAAPIALIALPERFSVWQVGASPDSSEELDHSPLETFELVVDRLSSVTPEAVRRWKQGSVQVPLFPVDVELLNRTRSRARNELTSYVENAMLQAREAQPSASPRLYSRLVIAALAVLLIRDKMNLGVTGSAEIDVAQQRFPSYFAWLNTLDSRSMKVLEDLISTLGADINFASLEPAMISDVYEQALLSVAARRAQGSYYSPPALGHRLLDAIPIESLRPSARYVMDPACGSGTLLLAAAARLEQLQPAEQSARHKHDYIVSHLRGYDQDSFAVEIAKLSLLMTALPIGNSWRVEPRDVLATDLRADDRPSIIVSNPPWGYTRQDGRRIERANQFLDWMIRNVRPGGFIGCILPVSWLNAQTSRQQRRVLNETCELLEIWQLPEATFSDQGSSSAAPAVIVARKREQKLSRQTVQLNTVLVRRVGSGVGQLEKFLKKGEATSSTLVEHDLDGEGFLDGPLARYLRSTDGLVPLSSVATIRSGCPHERMRPQRTAEDATHLELSSAKNLAQFGAVQAEDLHPVRYPDDFHHVNRSDDLVNRHKVLVSAKRSAESAYRMKVGLDLIGVVPRETFYMVLPVLGAGPWSSFSYEDQLFALMAILGSGLASNWVSELEPRRNISSGIYRGLPVPTRAGAVERLAQIGRLASDTVAIADRSALEVVATKLEVVVGEAYMLDEAMRGLIASNLVNRPAPEGVVRYISPIHQDGEERGQRFSSYGMVLDARIDQILVWVAGLTAEEGQWIAIPKRAPAWISKPGTDFTVAGESEDLSSANYFLHASDWVIGDAPGPASLIDETV